MWSMRQGTGNLILLGLAHSLNHSLFLVLPPLLDVISGDLGVSYQTIGSIATVSFLIYGVGALVGGPLSNRFGEVRVAVISITMAGVSSLIFLLPKSVTTFSIGTYLYAIWASFYHPTANTLISKLYRENTASAMGMHGAVASLAQVITPTVSYYIGTTYDWRYAYIFFGLASVVFGLLLLRIPKTELTVVQSWDAVKRLLRLRGLWIIIVFNIFIGLLQRGVELFFPIFLMNNRGLTGEVAAIANSALLVFAVAGQLLGGWAADRYTPRNALAVTSGGIFLGLLLLIWSPWPIIGVVLFVLVYGASFYGHQPTATALLGQQTPPDLMGASFGVLFFFVFGLGSISATVSGYVADNFGLEVTFQILGFLGLCVFISSLLILKIIGEERPVDG